MIVYRQWYRRYKKWDAIYEGWFLLGFIPIYIRRIGYEQ